MLRVRMKRLLVSRVFWAAVVLFAGIMIAGAYGDLLVAGANASSILYLYMVTTSIGIAHVLIAAVPTIPFAFFYVEELEKKAVYYNLIRCSKRSYYLSNIVAAVLSSVLVTVFALLIFVLVCLAFGAGFENSRSLMYAYEESVFAAWLEDGRLVYVLLINLLAFVAYSSPWGLLCLVISIFSKNKYAIISFPFIFHIASSYTLQLSPLARFDPGLTLLQGLFVLRMPYGGIFYALGYHGVFITVFSVYYYAMSRRRYRREGI
ncbi:MAG: hypothetical protein J1E01_10110 [Acetatifactor sp.]|nr:hypothetical protein [Acetatifactor sp.]